DGGGADGRGAGARPFSRGGTGRRRGPCPRCLRSEARVNRVFVTGIGCVSAAGVGRAALFGALAEGRGGVSPIRSFDAAGLPVRIAGEVPGFEPAAHVPLRILAKTDRFIHLALAAAAEAVDSAGLEPGLLRGPRCGIAIASNCGGVSGREEAHRQEARSPRSRPSPFLYASTAHAMATAWVSMRYGAEGPSYALANSSASGNQAIGLAARLLRWGEADIMLAGAA